MPIFREGAKHPTGLQRKPRCQGKNTHRDFGGAVALLTFPPSPLNGDQYPVNAVPGQNVYIWNDPEQTWRLLGTSTGVVAGTYGNALSVGQFTVDAAGRITSAQDLPIQLATTAQLGVVQLVDDTTTNSDAFALTAAQGYKLQSEIGDPSTLNPFYPNLVAAINAVGAPTGVTPGIYGNGTAIPRLTIDAQGRITFAQAVALAPATTLVPGVVRVGANLSVTGTGVLSVPNATTTAPGAVQLVNNRTTQDATKALTAEQGYALQQEIDALSVRNNLTFAGTLDAGTGLLDQATPEGIPYGFVAGSILPLANVLNNDFFVIVNVSGTYTPPAGTTVNATIGDWFLSDGTQWLYYNTGYGGGTVTSVTAGPGLNGGTITTSGTISLRIASTSQLGGVAVDGTSIIISPTGVISSLSASGTLQQVTDNGNVTTKPITTGGLTANGNVSLGGGGSSTIDVQGTISDSLVPTTSSLVDLGSAARLWRELYVSGGGIYFNTDRLNASGGILYFNGIPISGGPAVGNLQQVTTNGNSTVNAMIVSGGITAAGLKYPLTDGTAGQVLSTNGSTILGWTSTAKVVPVPANSAAPGAANQIAFGNGFFYWFDPTGNQWLRASGSTF